MFVIRVEKLIIVSLFAGLTLGCQGGAETSRVAIDEPRPITEPPSGLATGNQEWTTADGNRIPYHVAGNAQADHTVVMVHCWMCDRTFWDAQLPALAERYRTVTLDLPGHGEASSERETWTVAGYGEDVAGLLKDLALDNVVLMGHSMGGPVSLKAASLLPGKVRGIVAVDTLHNAELKFEGEQVDAILQSFENDFTGTCESFVEQMFPEEGAAELISKVRASGCEGKRAAVGAALMRDFGTIDMVAWFRDAGVPIRAINATAQTPTAIRVNRKYADFDAEFMEDVGHYLHMTRPEPFNELMLAALEGLFAPGS